MADVNEHRIEGRLTGDPKILRSDRGSIARMSVATNYRYQDRNNEWQERSTFHIIVVRGDLVDALEGLRQGDTLGVVGFAEDREFTDRDGRERSERQLVAKRLYRPMTARRSGSSDRGNFRDAPKRQERAERDAPAKAPPRASAYEYQGGNYRQDESRREGRREDGRRDEPAPSARRTIANQEPHAPQPASPQGHDVFADMDDQVRRM